MASVYDTILYYYSTNACCYFLSFYTSGLLPQTRGQNLKIVLCTKILRKKIENSLKSFYQNVCAFAPRSPLYLECNFWVPTTDLRGTVNCISNGSRNKCPRYN